MAKGRKVKAGPAAKWIRPGLQCYVARYQNQPEIGVNFFVALVRFARNHVCADVLVCVCSSFLILMPSPNRSTLSWSVSLLPDRTIFIAKALRLVVWLEAIGRLILFVKHIGRRFICFTLYHMFSAGAGWGGFKGYGSDLGDLPVPVLQHPPHSFTRG